MKLKDIKPGLWYETQMGVGQCVQSGGTHPPSVLIRIDLPFPRGAVNLRPRDVIREVPSPRLEAPL